MLSWKIGLKVDDENLIIYTRAETAKKAIGKVLLAIRKEDLINLDVFSSYYEINAGAITDPEANIIVYDSEKIRVECSPNLTIVPTVQAEDPFLESAEYIFLNLPRHLLNTIDAIDVQWLLVSRYNFFDHNFPDDDTDWCYDIRDAVEFIYNESIEMGFEYTKENIESFLRTAIEYEYATEECLNDKDFISVIDMSTISGN